MKDLTVIIPILTLDEKGNALLNASLGSVRNDTKVLIVGSEEAIKSITVSPRPFNKLVNSGDISYAAQVNLAVKSIKTKYFSVLEYDDKFTDIWLKNVENYISSDTENTFAFIPLMEVYDYATQTVIGYANEAVWATSFSEELGCYDTQCLDSYFNFNMSGAVIRKDVFESLGGLKESMKLVFWYEFMMRALYKEKRLFVIPKIGYLHNAGRDGSLTSSYTAEMSEKEADWWIDLAKKEYFFPQDRNKTYEE